RTLKLEAAVIRNVDLLVGVVDPERIGTHGDTSEIRGRTDLIEIGGSQPRLLRPLYDAPRIGTVNAAPIVGGQRQWHAPRRRERGISFALPAPGRLRSALLREHAIGDIVPELVVAQSSAKQQSAAQQA